MDVFFLIVNCDFVPIHINGHSSSFVLYYSYPFCLSVYSCRWSLLFHFLFISWTLHDSLFGQNRQNIFKSKSIVVVDFLSTWLWCVHPDPVLFFLTICRSCLLNCLDFPLFLNMNVRKKNLTQMYTAYWKKNEQTKNLIVFLFVFSS